MTNVELSGAIPWWIRALGAGVPRRIARNVFPPALVYSDACGEGSIGVTLFLGGRVVVANTHVPRRAGIFIIQELETTGAVSAMTRAAEYSPGSNALLRCDNHGAKDVAIRGHSGANYGRGLVLSGQLRRAH